MEFNKILVAVDGSPTADKGLEYAVDIAKKYESILTIIHVMNLPSIPYSIPGNAFNQPIPSTEEMKTYLKSEGDEVLLKRKEKLLREDVQANILLVFGDPAEEIIKISNEYDLIVLGSRGQSQLQSILLGSVSNKVTLYSTKPVLLIKP